MKKIICVIMLLSFLLVSVNPAFSSDGVFDYTLDFTSISEFPVDGIFEPTAYGGLGSGFKCKAEGKGFDINVAGLNSACTYTELSANFVWDTNLKIGFVPEGEAEIKDYIYFDGLSGNIQNTSGEVLASYKRASNGSNIYTIGLYTDSENDIAHLYFGGSLIAENILWNTDKIGKISFNWSKNDTADLRPVSYDVMVTCDEEKFPSLPEPPGPEPEPEPEIPPENPSDENFRFFEDFSGGTPSDERFAGHGYSTYSSGDAGAMRTKVQNTSGAGASVKTQGINERYYFECDAQFMFDIGFKMYAVDSKGDSETVFYDTLNSSLLSTDGNKVADLSAGSITRNIGILVTGSKAYLFENDILLCDMGWDIGLPEEIFFMWSNPGVSDFRPTLDNLLVTDDAEEFPTLPERYTAVPEVVSASLANGQKDVDITRNYITLDFNIEMNRILENDISFFYGVDQTPVDFTVSMSEDGKRLFVEAKDNFRPLEDYVLVVKSTVCSKLGMVSPDSDFTLAFSTADGILTSGNILFENESGVIRASAPVTNGNSKTLGATLLVCVCEGDYDEFITVSIISEHLDIASGETTQITAQTDEEIPEGRFIKAFLWESQNDMNPLTTGVVYIPE